MAVEYPFNINNTYIAMNTSFRIYTSFKKAKLKISVKLFLILNSSDSLIIHIIILKYFILANFNGSSSKCV